MKDISNDYEMRAPLDIVDHLVVMQLARKLWNRRHVFLVLGLTTLLNDAYKYQ